VTRWHDVPWRLHPNRVPRVYQGGLLLDRFRGAAEGRDTNEPEDWVGSATRAWTPPDAPPSEEGLAWAEVDGERRRVLELLHEDPGAVAGRAIAGTGSDADPTTGVLVKLLDAGVRLPVHAHPSRDFAARHLASPYGKAEAWIVLATRDIPGQPPAHVRLGFRRDVRREELRRWIADGATDALLDAMLPRATQAGDVWFVPPGVPHAIGAGILILEVQEPTDFSIVLETRDVPIGADDAHLRLGWDLAIDAIDRQAVRDDAASGLRSTWQPGVAPPGDRQELLPRAAGPFFRAERIVASGDAAIAFEERFLVGVVTAGRGTMATAGGELEVETGDAFAVPAAAVGGLRLSTADRFEAIVCQGGDAPHG
jgi:mannose-6-phosphate isomerase